jgi:hypothetical protein
LLSEYCVDKNLLWDSFCLENTIEICAEQCTIYGGKDCLKQCTICFDKKVVYDEFDTYYQEKFGSSVDKGFNDK